MVTTCTVHMPQTGAAIKKKTKKNLKLRRATDDGGSSGGGQRSEQAAMTEHQEREGRVLVPVLI